MKKKRMYFYFVLMLNIFLCSWGAVLANASGSFGVGAVVDVYSMEDELIQQSVRIVEETEHKIVVDIDGFHLTYYKDSVLIKKSDARVDQKSVPSSDATHVEEDLSQEPDENNEKKGWQTIPQEDQAKLNMAMQKLTTPPRDAENTCEDALLKEAVLACSSFECSGPHPFLPGMMTIAYTVHGFNDEGRCLLDINQTMPDGDLKTSCQFTEEGRQRYANLIGTMKMSSGDVMSECQTSIEGDSSSDEGSQTIFFTNVAGSSHQSSSSASYQSSSELSRMKFNGNLEQIIFDKVRKGPKASKLTNQTKIELEEKTDASVTSVFDAKLYSYDFYEIENDDYGYHKSYIPSLGGKVAQKNGELIYLETPMTNEEFKGLDEFIKPSFRINSEEDLKALIDAVTELFGIRENFMASTKEGNVYTVVTGNFFDDRKGFDVYVDDSNKVESVHRKLGF